MKHRNVLLSLVAIILIACAVIKPAVAYFTDNTSADGAIPLYFGRWTQITEELTGLKKEVTISNTGGDHPELADPIWVRAKVYSPGGYTDENGDFQSYGLDIEGEGWSEGDTGYWYYDTPVPVGGSANILKVELTGLPGNAEQNGEYVMTHVSVSVVYESTTAFYKEDGSGFKPAVWDKVLDYGQTSPGGN